MYVGDFGHNGTLEQILTFYKQGVSYPLAGRDELLSLIPRLRARYATYADFGAARVEDIFPAGEVAQATVREALVFASSAALNDGNGTFTLLPLPAEAQCAPCRAALVGDCDGDGRAELVVGGNLYGVPPVLGRYDASYGLLLSGMGDGRFTGVDMERSGLMIEGQVRHFGWLRQADGRRLILVARNNDRLQVLRPLRRSEEHTSELQSRGHLVCRLLLEKKKSRDDRRGAHADHHLYHA